MDAAAPNAPLNVLLQKVDHILRQHGDDPDLITDDDKLALAVQFVEVAHHEGLTATVHAGIYRL